MKQEILAESLPKNYKIEAQIASGGMGHVFRAHQADLDRSVAVKFLEMTKSGGRESFQRFKDEVKVCARLQHPNIVTLFDFDLECEYPYIVFEYVDGATLKDALSKRSLTKLSDALDIMANVADALEYAHGQGVVHRDLKPENILITRDRSAKVADFGLAKLAGVTGAKTNTGIVMGTPEYLSPEQIEGRPITGASDMYAFGAILFQLAVGSPPFTGNKAARVMQQHLEAMPPRLLDCDRKLPELLDHLVDVCLQKSADDRPADVGEVAQAIRDLALDIRAKGDGLRIPRRARLRQSTSRRRVPATQSTVQRLPQSMSVLRKAMVAVAIVVPLLLMAFLAFRAPSASVDSSTVEVQATAAKSVLVQWKTSWPAGEATMVLQTTGDVEAQTERTVTSFLRPDEKKEPPFTYAGVLRDLEPGTSYLLSLSKPDGSKTLPVKVNTAKLEPFKPVQRISLDDAGQLVCTVASRVPVSLRFNPAPKTRRPIGQGRTPVYAGRIIAHYELSSLVRDPAITAAVTSLDGDEHRFVVDVRKYFRQTFAAAIEDFVRSRKDGDYWLLFNEADEGIGKLFRDGERRLQKLSPQSSPAERKTVEAELWSDLLARLETAAWYRALHPLLPGLPDLLASKLCNEELREQIGMTLVALSLINRAATTHAIPAYEPWQAVLAPEKRPYPLRFGTPRLTGDVGVHRFLPDIELVSRKVNLMFDEGHPKFVHIFGKGLKADFFSSQKWFVRLGEDDINGVAAGELELAVRTAIEPSIIIVDINDGKFRASFEPRQQDVAEYQQWRRESGANVREVSMALTGDLKQKGKMEEFLKVIEEGLFPEPRYLYHWIPLSCLYKGTNKVFVYQLAAPLDSLEHVGVTSVKLRLARQ